MKLLVFAHIPPPHHGQSAMVKLLLDELPKVDGFEIEIHHVDARFSDRLDEVGQGRLSKILRVFRFAFRAIRLRFTEGVRDFYYVPAPPKPAAMIRDWMVMALCRPFFPRIYLHWHAVGLGEWTDQARNSKSRVRRMAAWLNQKLLGGHYRSLVLTEWGRADVALFNPQSIRIVPNGLPDPCADFATSLLPVRNRRIGELRGESQTRYRVAFLGHCTAEKGLWDAMEAVAIVASRGQLIQLHVAGEFPSSQDRDHFAHLREKLTTQHQLAAGWVEHLGFVAGEAKRRLLEDSDALCFPTRYSAESFGLVAVEALAFGIPAVTSDWRMLPDLMALAELPVSPVSDPEALADALNASIGRDEPARLRQAFIDHFTINSHLTALAESLQQ